MTPKERVVCPWVIVVWLLVCRPAPGQWLLPGQSDFAKANVKVLPVGDDLSLIQLSTPQQVFNTLVLAGPQGYLLVDHPEPAANPAIQRVLDRLGERPVKFLLNTHWHYDHVGGNAIYGPDAVIVAHESVRKRLIAKQSPYWSPRPIGPSPQRAWPVITFRDSVTIHFGNEDVEMDHYTTGHTDTDSVVYFAHADVVDVGDLFWGKGNLAGGADVPGIARSLTAVLDRIDNRTVIVTGHTGLSNRRDLTEYVYLLNETIALVRHEIADGKSEKNIVDAGLANSWKAWFAPDGIPDERQFMHDVYASLTNTSQLNQ